MINLSDIYNKFYELNPYSSNQIIKFYETNQILLNNKTTFNNEEDFKSFILLSARYIQSLEDFGRYSKTIEYANKTLNIIEQNINKFDINLNDFTYYWSILTSKGRSLYYLNDYKNSILVFKKLVKWDKENDNLKSWLESSKSKMRNSINKYLYLIAFILIISEIIFGSYLTNKIKLYLSISGFIILMIAFINEYFANKIIKKINN